MVITRGVRKGAARTEFGARRLDDSRAGWFSNLKKLLN
jgi:hypothetical protein